MTWVNLFSVNRLDLGDIGTLKDINHGQGGTDGVRHVLAVFACLGRLFMRDSLMAVDTGAQTCSPGQVGRHGPPVRALVYKPRPGNVSMRASTFLLRFGARTGRECLNFRQSRMRLFCVAALRACPAQGNQAVMMILFRRALIPLVLLLAAGTIWFFMGRGEKITVAGIARGAIAEAVYATGSVEPLTWAKVLPLVRARIIDHCRCEGKSVKKGDVLARLDDTAPQADLKQAEARRGFSAAEFARQNDLFARGITTKQALERAQAELLQGDRQIDALKARLRDYLLLSPADGMVLRSDAQVGDIPATTDTLFTVGEPLPLRVVGEVNEEDIARITLGQRALLRNEGFGGRALESSVAAITPKGDPAAKTFRIYLALPGDTPLRIGMNVEANIVIADKKDVLLAPAEAVRDAGTPKAQVFVVSGGALRAVAVTTGIRGTRFIEISGDIKEGDRLAAPLKPEFRDGLAVRVK
jgi:membrane fusion protein (multidrug efflux system)